MSDEQAARMACGCYGVAREGGWDIETVAILCPYAHRRGSFVADDPKRPGRRLSFREQAPAGGGVPVAATAPEAKEVQSAYALLTDEFILKRCPDGLEARTIRLLESLGRGATPAQGHDGTTGAATFGHRVGTDAPHTADAIEVLRRIADGSFTALYRHEAKALLALVDEHSRARAPGTGAPSGAATADTDTVRRAIDHRDHGSPPVRDPSRCEGCAAVAALDRLVAATADREQAARQARDLLQRLSQWDVLYVSPGGTGNTADAPYWQREIAKVRAVLSGGGEAS